jgi:hypothetical protein
MPMKRLLAIALLLLPAPLCAQPLTYGVTPGYWEIKTNWLGLYTKTERDCLVPERIAKFLSGPCNHNYKCSYPIQTVADGHAHFEGDIRGHDEAYHVTGGGTYSATTLDMSMSGSGHWHIVPMLGHAWVKAHLIAPECPVGAKKL